MSDLCRHLGVVALLAGWLAPAAAIAAPAELPVACRKELFDASATAAACKGIAASRTMVVVVGTGSARRGFIWSRLGDAAEVLYACEPKEGCGPPEKKGAWAMVPAATPPPVEVLTYVKRPVGLVRLGKETVGRVPRLDQAVSGVKREARLSECVKAWAEGDKPLAELKNCTGSSVEAAVALSAIVKRDPGKEPRFAVVRRPPPEKPPLKPTDPPASLVCFEQDRGQWFKSEFVGCLERLLTTEALTTRVEPDPFPAPGAPSTASPDGGAAGRDGGAATPAAADGGSASTGPARTPPPAPPR
jgi:hypothetical protein